MSRAPAAGHALRILGHLAGRVAPVPAAAIARSLDLPRSSTYRLLDEMATLGFVTHYADDGTWGLGVAAAELASGYQRQTPLQRIARPALQRLVDATTHNAHLAVLHGRDVLYVIEERAPGRALLVTDVGVRLPATHTASGLAMLAALPARQVTALHPSASTLVTAPGTPSTVTALRRELVDVRRRGYAREDGTVTDGLSSIAHAVLDREGQPVAAVAITYPSALATSEVDRLVRAASSTAGMLSSRLR